MRSSRSNLRAMLLLTATWFAAPAAADERSLTLQQALEMALKSNETLIGSRESLAAAGEMEYGARGAYDPALELSGASQRSTQPVNSVLTGSLAPDVRSTQAGMTVHQLLSTGGVLSLRANGSRQTSDGAFTLLSPAYGAQLGAELRQPLLRDRTMDAAHLTMAVTTADRRGAESSFRRTLNETLAAVEKSYWGLVSARQEVGVREEAVRLAAEQLEETRTRVASGSAPGTELAQPRAELGRRQAELFAAHEDLARADHRLKLLILADDDAAPWGVTIAPVDTGATDSVAIDREAWVHRALAGRPEIGSYQAQVERRRAETTHARDAERPALDAVVSYDRYGLAGSANPVGAGGAPPGLGGDLANALHSLGNDGFDAFRAGLVLGFPVGNRAARGETESARHLELDAESELARARKAIRVEVLDAAAALETATRRIEATRMAREAAEIQLAAEQDRYRAGQSTNFLVLTRQNDLSAAQLDEIAARTDFLTARTEVARATGSLAEDRGIDAASLGGTR